MEFRMMQAGQGAKGRGSVLTEQDTGKGESGEETEARLVGAVASVRQCEHPALPKKRSLTIQNQMEEIRPL